MLSDDWKKEAINRFPEFTSEDYENWETPYLCWFDLTELFEQAYGPPRNEDAIKRVYDFCDWCLSQPRGTTAEDDLFTCVAVCFIEHIPTVEEALKDMPRWFDLESVKESESILSYHVGKEGFQRILDVFKDAKKRA